MAEEDDSLLCKATAGDADALAALLKRHAADVRASISGGISKKWRSLLSEDDVMQQTYADAFTDIRQFDPDIDGSFTGWLCRAAQGNLRDAIRMLKAVKRGGRQKRVGLDDPLRPVVALVNTLSATGTSPSRYATRMEIQSLLDDAMAQLPPSYRHVVRMFDLEGYHVDRVAEHLGRSVGAVYMIRARAHDQLRALLGETANFFTDSA